MPTRAELRSMVRLRLEDTSPTPLWDDATLNDALGAAIARRHRDELLDALIDAGAPAAPALTPEEAATRVRRRHRHDDVPRPGEHERDPWGGWTDTRVSRA